MQAADARWAAKPSVLDRPRRGGGGGEVGAGEGFVGVEGRDGEKGAEGKDVGSKDKVKENPWKVRQGNPGEGWQPDAWAPGLAKK